MIRVHWNITVLSMASDSIAEEVKALQPIDQISQRAFSETMHIIAEEEADELVEALTKQGYTVRVETP